MEMTLRVAASSSTVREMNSLFLLPRPGAAGLPGRTAAARVLLEGRLA